MGRKKLDSFARLYVVPQGGHGLSGRSYKVSGDGDTIAVKNIPAPSSADRMDLLISWVEEGKAPAKTLDVGTDGRIGEQPEVKGYILCSYPNYPKYTGGDKDLATSYVSSSK